ncbi:MAG: hypothetical protein ILP04_04015 [Bacteroidales bacterium]|nr:hypothetical protein [Bacteroidales bacterium]
MKRLALLPCCLLLFLLLPSCREQEEKNLPRISWSEPSARYRIHEGEQIKLIPIVQYTDETTVYLWMVDDRVLSTATLFNFNGEQAGEFYVKLIVSNRYGETQDEVKVTVLAKETQLLPELPPPGGWKFPWTSINIAQGRSIKVKAYMTEGQDEVSQVFHGTAQGRYTVTLTALQQGAEVSQDFIINVCPPEGSYRRGSAGQALVDRVYEFMPAPGHQVNGYIIVGDAFPDGCTHQQACDTVLAHFQRRWSISLGAQGGYLIAGFDHSVPASTDGYDLCIKGNPFSYQSEPGIIWVSQDDNGDGLPNDQWFELAGSEYGTDNETLEYAITYYRPRQAGSAIGWRDCQGKTGYVPYMEYWNPHDSYWQPWVEGTATTDSLHTIERTWFGSRLRDRSTYQNGMSDMPAYDWGYVDNLGDFFEDRAGKMGYYKISQARTWDGQPANLQYIDFIKIQTSQTGSTPNLGEISTEVYYISDYHLEPETD